MDLGKSWNILEYIKKKKKVEKVKPKNKTNFIAIKSFWNELEHEN